MAISTRPFHPLDVKNNKRYSVDEMIKESEIPKIEWRDTVGDEPYEWKGYIHVPEDQTFRFSMELMGNGYIEIDGEKIIDAKEVYPGTVKKGERKLKKGYHHVTVYYEFFSESCKNPATSRHPEVFLPLMNEKDFELWKIDEPKNLWRIEDAKGLLACYNVVDYYAMPESSMVYDYIGGWLNKKHLEEIQNGIPMQNRDYKDSCALRLSIALTMRGYNLEGVDGAVDIGADSKYGKTPGHRFLIMRAAKMVQFLTKLLKVDPDYPDSSMEKGYFTPQDGDIIIFGNNNHVGMGPGTDIGVGKYVSIPTWLLHRDTLDDNPEEEK